MYSFNILQFLIFIKIIKSVAETGVNVIVSGGSIGEMALHFIERYHMMAIKVPSKFELRRVSKAVGATPLVRLVRSFSHNIFFFHFDTKKYFQLKKTCISYESQIFIVVL